MKQLDGYETIAIAGDGASGRQLAAELANAGKSVILFRGKKRPLVPNRLLGRDIFWWLDKSKAIYADANSMLGKLLRRRNPTPCAENNDNQLRTLGVTLARRLTNISTDQLHDSSGSSHKIDAVIWALGYEDDTSWLHMDDATGSHGFVCDRGHTNGGKTPYPGLYCIGRKWLSCRASELLMGASLDSIRICNFITTFLSAEENLNNTHSYQNEVLVELHPHSEG
jgi:putative flavoprotein involved in K+ transport